MQATAPVDAFLDPPNWSFWGQPGARAIRHSGTTPDGRAFVHFIVRENGRESHRLAYGIAVTQEVS
jgi:hypothetical protein